MKPPRCPLVILLLALMSPPLCAQPASGASATAPAATAPTTIAVLATQPAPYKPTLLAHGNAGRFWIAYVESVRDGARVQQRTVIRGQVLPAGQWEELTMVYGQAVALASLQNELVVLLDDGTWKRVGQSLSSGPSLSAGTGPILALASTPQALFAIRGVEGGMAGADGSGTPATAPSAARAAATTSSARGGAASRGVAGRSTARAAAARLPTPVLFRFQRGQWSPVAQLPDEAAGRSLALTTLGGRPEVAAEVAPATIETWLLEDGRWQDWGRVSAAPGTGRFALLSTPTSAGLWTIDQDGAMQLFLRSEAEAWSQSKSFAIPANVPANAQRTLAVAGEELHLVLLKDAKLMEQHYDLSGKPRGGLAELPAPKSSQPGPLQWILQSAALVVMVLVMLVTLYRRRAAQQQQPPADKPQE